MPRSTHCSTTSRSACQSARQLRRVEVQVVDVLVALRRVLGVLQRPVGAAVEPLRMLGQPGVIGRAVDREVERDLETRRLRGGDHRVEVVRGAELGVERVVAAVLRRRSPTASRRRRAWRARRCSGPCGSSGRSGEPAGGRRRRSRARRARAAPSATPRKPPNERGKSSYHDPNRASARSTSTSSGSDSTLAEAVAGGRGERLLDGQLVAAEQSRALGELAREVGLAARLLCAGARPARSRSGRSRRRR